METCAICERVKRLKANENPALIHEFKHSYLVLGDHQFFKGYSLLLLKKHARELHDLTEAEQGELFEELMKAGKAVFEAFRPWKMNYSCYGNQDPHVHWHLFPRYESDPDHKTHPWLNSARFKDYVPSASERDEAIQKIRARL